MFCTSDKPSAAGITLASEGFSKDERPTIRVNFQRLDRGLQELDSLRTEVKSNEETLFEGKRPKEGTKVGVTFKFPVNYVVTSCAVASSYIGSEKFQ